MSVMTEERRDQAAIRRPASGITIDPGRLIWHREDRIWSRQDLSDAVTRLDLSDENGDQLTVTRDAIAKIENGERKPKARTVRALCAALGITVRDLMPDGEPLAPHASSEERQLRLAHNKDLRAFARAHGIQYRNPVSGRVYYSVPLKDAFAASVAGVSDERVAVLVALAREPAQDWEDSQPGDGITPDDGIEELDLAVRTHNALIRGELPGGTRHGIRTVGELAGLTGVQLAAIRNIGGASLAEIREKLGAAGFALSGEEAGDPGPELLAS